MNLSQVSILIKTFLRDDFLFRTISSIETNLPDAKMIIIDDGDQSDDKNRLYQRLKEAGHVAIQTPFDIGFGAKSNICITHLSTSYLLIASDDFDFSPKSAREGVEKMLNLLHIRPDIDIVSGRVNGRPYEFMLKDEGSRVTELSIPEADKHHPFFFCDLTVNYSLIKREVFEKVRWDDEAKIGQGEHGAFYLKCKRAGFKVTCIPSANVNEYREPSRPRYRQFRSRASDSGRICFDKLGVKKYVLGNGAVDYDATRSC